MIGLHCTPSLGLRLLCTACLSVVVAGCESGSLMEQAGLRVDAPEGWRPLEPGRVVVPGESLAAWAGPDGASLAIYRTLAIPRPSAEDLSVELATRSSNQPGWKVVRRSTRKLGDGREAAWVEVTGPGAGSPLILAPTSLGVPAEPTDGRPLTPTRRINLSIPRVGDTIVLSWHLPEAAEPRLRPAVDATIASLAVGTGRTDGY